MTASTTDTRLICFFSVGSKPFLADYACGEGAPFAAMSVLCAAFQHRLVERQGRRVVFVLVGTPETRGGVEQTVQEDLIRYGHYRPDEDGWEVITVEGGAPDGVQRALDGMLGRIQSGDEVFVEPTTGLRSISLALVFGALYIRVLRPEVKIRRLAYGEVQERGGRKVSALHDISELLAVYDWSREAHTFGSLLLGQGLAERIEASERDAVKARAAVLRRAGEPIQIPRISPALNRLSAAIATTQIPLIIRELRQLRVDQHVLTGFSEREALSFFGREIASLQEAAAHTTADVLDEAWLEAELRIIERLDAAGRAGDAMRMLREWATNVVLLAGWVGPVPERWYETGPREVAETWLSRHSGARVKNSPLVSPWLDLVRLAGDTHQYRNSLSHGGYQHGGEGASLHDTKAMHRLVKRARQWWDENRTQRAPGDVQAAVPEVHGGDNPVVDVFLNLSNHPVSGWSEPQRRAAACSGGVIVDLAFPEIDPTHDSYQPQLDAVLDQVARVHRDTPIRAAMVQGEPVATVELVRALQSRGIVCYAATTRRDVSIEDGKKISTFHFDHFRPWPVLIPPAEERA